MSTPPIIIIIGPHAYHFANLAEAAAFLESQKSDEVEAPQS
ncbi:hypothetical protein FHW84_002497 [Dyella sp. SG562]|nr:hypothetical protein [Dyella sp. SG562]NII73924.1 hypothetical protein [Dyella sp. SG562]